MKKITLVAFALTFIASINLFAQTADIPVSKIAVIQIKTSGECDMCKTKIENTIGVMKGVKKTELDIPSQILTVAYNTQKTTPEKIKNAIAEIGYDADEVKANNRAAKKLPACCQPQPRPEIQK